MKIESTPLVLQFDPFSTVAAVSFEHGIGEAVRVNDGRVFRSIIAGGSGINPGKLQLAPAPKTNHHNCTAIVSAALTQDPTFTLGATATVAGEYDEGYIVINVTPDVGRSYKIARMGLIGSGGVANPHLYEPIVTAWTTATRVSLVHNAFKGVVEGTAVTRRGAGVPLVAIATTAAGFAQTRGVAGVLCDTASTLGAPQIAGAQPGSIKDQTDNLGASAEVQVAVCSIMVGADTEYRPQFLTMD